MVTGHELRLLRHLHEIKQETLAKKLNITQQAYSKLEKNQCINGKRLHQIITALGYTKKEFEKAIKKLPPPPPKKLAIGS